MTGFIRAIRQIYVKGWKLIIMVRCNRQGTDALLDWFILRGVRINKMLLIGRSI